MDLIAYECRRLQAIKNSPEYKALQIEKMEAIKKYGWHSLEHEDIKEKIINMQGLRIYTV